MRHPDEVPVMFFVVMLLVLVWALWLCVRGLRDKTPRRPLTPEERLHCDMQALYDQRRLEEFIRRGGYND